MDKLPTSIVSTKLPAADCRVRLLNYISTAPIDCPVAVVFGHAAALNWLGAGFADAGLTVANGLWAEGFYADLIPSSEIALGNFKLGSDGRAQYGPQRYESVVLYHPQYEKPAIASFFQELASRGKTALYGVGRWTNDFQGNAFDGAAALPVRMQVGEVNATVSQVIAHLKSAGIEPQTTCEMRGGSGFPFSMMPRRSGLCRLLDGTVILASGQRDVLGDPIQKTMKVGGQEVTFDAIGVAAVRLGQDGKLEALAAGGLKLFRGAGLSLEMPERLDVVLWRDARNQWQGILQDWTGPVPAPLAALTSEWRRLAVPKPYQP